MAKNPAPKGKDKSPKRSKRSRPDQNTDSQTAPFSSIATHPRALASVHKARSWAGLIAFALAAALSMKAHVPLTAVGVRALAAGCVGYLLAWWGAMKIWRHLMIAEQRAAVAEINRRRAERRNGNATPGT
ncbi:MAG: hypothetical protein ACP5H2_04580 [Solirubrobacteraceae bacterium]